ncbi:hypothetical protein FF3_00596 [Fretibacterium fastidiosum]
MDPKTGTFLSLDPHQGNRQDPLSLHKYLYANANPVNNTDPTGLFSLGEMTGSLFVLDILNGTVTLNYALAFQMLMNAAHVANVSYSITALVTAALTGKTEGVLLAIANGLVSIASFSRICESHLAMQILTKALAAYGANESLEAFLKAVRDDDVPQMLLSALQLSLNLAVLHETCFDGDTLVATEAGFKRIDEVQAGDRVWSYNVETGERALKAVKEVLVRENDELLHIETSRGAIDATTNHPFYVVGKGWVAAGDLVVGDAIQALSGDAGVVTGLRLEKLESPIPVYNLDVEDFHSYFVAGGVLVHNVCVEGRGLTGRTEPRNLMEEMACEAAKKYPFEEHSGKELMKIVDEIGDERWKGWQILSRLC